MSTSGVVASEWKELNLPQLQEELDAAASEIAGRQDAAEGQRRLLVDASKDFKKTASEDVRKTVAPLLKLFQGEVDNLSKRSKAAEAAFLSLYRKIVSLPDPLPALENAASWQKKAQRSADLEMEVGNLRDTLKQYSEEFAEVKNQEVTIRQLRETLKSFEDSAEATIQEKVSEREAALRAAAEERARAEEEAAAALQRKLAQSEAEVGRLEASLAAARDELFRLRTRFEDRSDAGAAQWRRRATRLEVELLQEDAERATQRAEAAERQLAEVQAQLEALRAAPVTQAPSEPNVPADEADSDSALIASLRLQLSAKEAQVAAHVEELGRGRQEAESAAASAAEKAAALEAELEALRAQLDEAQQRLGATADYDEINNQLKTLMSMEFGDANTERKSLEVLLLGKNKALQSELTALKLAHAQLQGGDGSDRPSSPAHSTTAVKTEAPDSADDDECSKTAEEPEPSGDDRPSTSPPGPLQPLVETFGALLGAEVAAQLAQPQPELERLRNALFGFHPNGSPLPADLAQPADLIRQLQDLSSAMASVAAAAQPPHLVPAAEDEQPPPLTPPPTLTAARQEEPVEAALSRLGLPDVEAQVKTGTPRYIAEQTVTDQLQAIINENVAKLENVSLNTGQVAGNCRTLLSLYNLGQRLFAKSILNQSQGSLSELLSKPRPWARLTEKGREAFRKMHAWVSDERAITLLRSLSPRRSYLGSCFSGLSPATTANPVTSPSAATREGLEQQRERSIERPHNNRWRHDDIPKEMVQEIYQRELAKLREQENSISAQMQVKAKGLISPGSGGGLTTGTPTAATTTLPRLTPSNKPELSLTPSSNGGASPGLGIFGGLFPERQHRQRGLLRAVLPQITQEQFEQFSHIDTEQLVHRVKEFLSQHSISQRLFGEHVLGLSQGSVSDLLARPKPWQMLTQKGREPFIRMQLFLADPAALDNLRARKTPRGASTTIMRGSESPGLGNLLPKGDVADLLDSINRATQQASTVGGRTSGRFLDGRAPSNASSESLSLNDGDMDTAAISDAVRRLLHENSIGQKLFGEAVLGVSQGTVSELLSKPKPWSTLSLRGREPYIRMNAWLQDPMRIEKLRQYMMLMKSGRGMKRSPSNVGTGSELSELVSSLFQPAAKKPRSLITEQQKEALKFAYEHEPYPSSKTVEFLAKELALSVPTVTNWFHNHRMRVKNQAGSTTDTAFSASATGGSTLASPSSSSAEETPTAPLHNHSPPKGRSPSPAPLPLSAEAPGPGNTWKKGLMDLISLLGDEDDSLHAHHHPPLMQDVDV